MQLIFLIRLKLLPRPRINRGDAGVRRIVRLMVPALFGVSVAQLSLLLDTVLASFLTTGSISWLYFSDRLMEFPLGIVGVALGTVILPKLSRRHAEQSPEAFSETIDWALRWVLLLGLPAAVGLMALAGPLMATLFHSGEFTAHDVEMAARSLTAYAAGLMGFLGVKVLAPGYYARLDMRSPVRIAVIALGVNIVVKLALMAPLGHVGLALATTVSALVNAGLLLRGLVRAGIYRPPRGWGSLLSKGLAACAVMGLLVWWGSGPTAAWIGMGDLERIGRLCGWIAAGGVAYGLALLVLAVRPRDFRPR